MIRVLIVEDEPLIAEAHQAYLQRLEGFSVAAVAHTARDAMRAAGGAAANETPIDLVLLDIGLPDASGIALASGLSGLRPAPDIIAITSERDLEMVRAAVGHGALAYLLKPFTFAAFRDRLERYQRYREALPAGTDAASQAEVDRALAELRVGADRYADSIDCTADSNCGSAPTDLRRRRGPLQAPTTRLPVQYGIPPTGSRPTPSPSRSAFRG